MTPETAITELSRGLELALMVGGPLLLVVLVVGVVVGLLQAATQVNEPTVAFVAKAVAMVVALAAMGSFLLGQMVEFTIALFQRIPSLVADREPAARRPRFPSGEGPDRHPGRSWQEGGRVPPSGDPERPARHAAADHRR